MSGKKLNVIIIPTGGMGVDGITSSIMNYYNNINHDEIHFTFILTKVKGGRDFINKLKENINLNNDKIVEINRGKNIFKYIVNLIKVAKKSKANIIHIHGSSSLMCIELIVAKFVGIPIRITHSHNTKCNHNNLNKLLKPLFLYLTTTRIACGIDAGKWLFGKNDFYVLNNGIEVEKFTYNHQRSLEMVSKLKLKDKRVIGHIGNFNEQKNHIFLIKILKELVEINPKYHLILVGDGPKYGEIEEKINELGLNENVSLLGRRNDITDILQVTNVMVLPSLYEGLPVVAIEWQAAGLKCILSDCITKEVKLTDLVEFMSLNESPKTWASKIDNIFTYERSSKYANIVSKLGYDGTNNANRLIEIYNNCSNKN